MFLPLNIGEEPFGLAITLPLEEEVEACMNALMIDL